MPGYHRSRRKAHYVCNHVPIDIAFVPRPLNRGHVDRIGTRTGTRCLAPERSNSSTL
jgi:hypothetical protein